MRMHVGSISIFLMALARPELKILPGVMRGVRDFSRKNWEKIFWKNLTPVGGDVWTIFGHFYISLVFFAKIAASISKKKTLIFCPQDLLAILERR